MNNNLSQTAHAYIVVPVFNEKHRFKLSYWEEMIRIKHTTWIFIDDGSTDGTNSILTKLSRSNNQILLKNTINVGKGSTIRIGYQYVIGELASKNYLNSISPPQLFGYLDSDGAFSLDEVREFIEFSQFYLNGTSVLNNRIIDAVWASRVKLQGHNIERSVSRHIIGRFIHTIIGIFIRDLPYDSQCGLKIFRINQTMNQIFENKFKTRWLFDLEILLRGTQNSSRLKIWEKPLINWKEVPGGKLKLKSSILVLKEIITLISYAVRAK
jgi:dolichyl-phosphate beta-glucosyltransferase